MLTSLQEASACQHTTNTDHCSWELKCSTKFELCLLEKDQVSCSCQLKYLKKIWLNHLCHPRYISILSCINFLLHQHSIPVFKKDFQRWLCFKNIIYTIHNIYQCTGAISSDLNPKRTFPRDNKPNAINRAFHLTNTSCLKTAFIYDALLWTRALPV